MDIDITVTRDELSLICSLIYDKAQKEGDLRGELEALWDKLKEPLKDSDGY